MQEDLIGVLHVWGSRVSVVCAPALLAKEREKANSGLSNRKPDVGGRWMGLAVWSDLHLLGGAWKAQLVEKELRSHGLGQRRPCKALSSVGSPCPCLAYQ